MNQEWQPIETAPKDGTDVLVAKGKLVCIAFWTQFFPEDEYTDGYAWCGADDTMLAVEPTHWMPLPQPPTTDKQ